MIVVGGGVAGTSCAYHLAQAGTPVVLLERTALAAGSSGRSAAFIETQYLDEDRVRMCVYGLRLYQHLAKRFPLKLQTRGKLLLGNDQRDRLSFEASLRLQHELGLRDATILERRDIANRFPALRTSPQEFALYGPSDGYLDPVALCHAYAAAAAEHGASIHPSTEARAITATENGYTVTTDRVTFAAQTVIIAVGPWTDPIARLLDLPLPVRGYRRQVATLAAAGHTSCPLVVDPHSGAGCLYFRDDGPGRLLAGLHTEERNAETAADPDRYERAADPSFTASLALLVSGRLRTAPLRPLGGWAGLYPISADGRIVLGESCRRPGLFICAGLAGNGIQLSAAAGAITAQLVQHEAQTILPSLESYTPDRFLDR